MKHFIILLAGALLFSGCNMTYEKTKSGLRYKIIEGKGGKQLKAGEFVKFNQILLIPERDTVLYTTYGKMPAYAKIDTGAMTQYSFMEILPMCSVGDSVIVIFSVDSLMKKQMLPTADFNDVFRRGGQITCRMKILKSYSNEAEVNADFEKDRQAENERQMKEMQANSQKEVKEIEDYLKKNNIKTTKTASGAYVEVQQQGSGPLGDTGAVAEVYYTGKLFKDGTKFDSNVDPEFRHTEALNVPLGMGGAIKGFEEGLMYFGKGGKGRIFIPSFAGYGAQGAPPRIPPNAALIFEVEIRDIKPKQTGAGAVPPAH